MSNNNQKVNNNNENDNKMNLNDSLEDGNEDDNNLEYTKSNARSESKSYRVSDLPLMEVNSDNFNIKNDVQKSFNDEEKKNYNNENNNKNDIDEMYKQLIINKRMNMFNNKNNIYSKSNNNMNNIKNEDIIIQQRYNTNININQINFDKSIENDKIDSKINNTNIHNCNNTTFSTQSQTGMKNNNKGLNFNNKLISEFIINDSLFQRNDYKDLSDINDNNDENRNYLKTWLKNIDLFQYYNNFLENDVYDINKLVSLMKSNETKLKYDDIERLLGIKKPGHIFRILVKLEIDCELIDTKIVKFMIKKLNT